MTCVLLRGRHCIRVPERGQVKKSRSAPPEQGEKKEVVPGTEKPYISPIQGIGSWILRPPDPDTPPEETLMEEKFFVHLFNQ